MFGNLGDSTIIFHDDSVMLEGRSFFKDEEEDANKVKSNVNLLEQLNLNNGSDQKLRYFSQVHESPVKKQRELYQTNEKNKFFEYTPDMQPLTGESLKEKTSLESPIKPYITDKFRSKITQISTTGGKKIKK